MEKRTILLVSGALLSAEGKLLLLRRKSGQWELPGGELDFGEVPELGLIRIYAEVCGVDISLDRPLGAWSTVESEDGVQKHLVHLDYTVRSAGAFTGVDVDFEAYAGFAWLTEAEAAEKIQEAPVRAAVARAFALLTRTRKNG